ncbi:hypothetical protein [Sporosarcina ureae]|nr:hypothetical protein [Sporosarcina ureae]
MIKLGGVGIHNDDERGKLYYGEASGVSVSSSSKIGTNDGIDSTR